VFVLLLIYFTFNQLEYLFEGLSPLKISEKLIASTRHGARRVQDRVVKVRSSFSVTISEACTRLIT